MEILASKEVVQDPDLVIILKIIDVKMVIHTVQVDIETIMIQDIIEIVKDDMTLQKKTGKEASIDVEIFQFLPIAQDLHIVQVVNGQSPHRLQSPDQLTAINIGLSVPIVNVPFLQFDG
jgi:hypothetical protein